MSWDEAFAEVERRLTAVLSGAGPRRRRRLHRQPERPQLRQHARDPAARQGARDEERLLGLDRRPDAEARRLRPRLRPPARDPGARHRPHRSPAAARRQPARVERQPRDRTGLARPPRGDPATRRARRRRRSRAGRGRPSTPTCTCRSARAPTPPCSRVSRWCSSPKASRIRARSPTRVSGIDLVDDGGGRLHAGARGVAHRRAGRHGVARSPVTSPPPRRRSSTAASAPTRPPTARSRRGSSTCSTSSPGTSTSPGGAMFPHAAHEQPHRPPRAFRTGRWHEPRARPAGGAERAARGDARRRDGDARRGPGAGAADDRRQSRP